MRIVILVYSITGNTRYVAEVTARALESSGGHTVRIFDIVDACRECSKTMEPRGAISETISVVRESEAVGVGVLTWSWHVPPGVVDLIRRIGESGAFQGKPAFSFATAGGGDGMVPIQLFDALTGARAVPLLYFDMVPAPDNWWAVTAPSFEGRYVWGENSLVNATQSGEKLGTVLAKWATEPAKAMERPAKGWLVRGFNALFVKSAEDFKGDATGLKLKFRDEKCIGCGLCARQCIGGALTMVATAGEKSSRRRVVIDPSRCCACSRCFTFCPAHAIEIVGLEGNHFHVFDPRSTLKPGRSNFTIATYLKNAIRNKVRQGSMVTKVAIVAGLAIVAATAVMAFARLF